MYENPDWLRHRRVTQHASFHREKVRPSRPLVGVNSFDLEVSTFGSRVSLTSSSRRHVSRASLIAPEA